MGKIKSRIDLARSRARQRRAVARRRWHNMSLRTAFVWYVLIAAVIATIVCSVMINSLDGYRGTIYRKYQDMAVQIPIPAGGLYDSYVTTDAERA